VRTLPRPYILRGLLLTIMLSILVPASFNQPAQLRDQLTKQEAIIAELQRQIALTRDQIAHREQELADLQRFIAEQEESIRMSLLSAGGQKGVELMMTEHPWLGKFRDGTMWDRIVIEDSVVIEDPLIIRGINQLICLQTTDTGRYPNGYRMHHTFDFYEGDMKHTLVLIDQHAIEVDQHQLFLWPDCNLYRVIEAFLPAEPFVRHDGLIAKMAASGAVRRGDLYVLFSKTWVHRRVRSFVDREWLEQKPEQPGDRLERFTFYYHGEELYMDIYPQYVHLSGQGEELWYYDEEAGQIAAGEPG
jgi:hypothetical protein